jgi:ribosomal protein L3 glutamine methyltransferase
MRSAERRRASHPTLRAALRAAARRLESAGVSYGHGTTRSADEAAWLALHALGLPLDALGAHLNRALSAAELGRVDALIEERIRTRKPAAYLTHEAWLGEHRFYVDERVIVPRSYIAELLQDDLAPWIQRPDSVESALDLCTGSGCLAILLALAFRRARIVGADISGDALQVARRNVADYRLKRRVSLLQSNLFGALRGQRFDLIVSNPPYVRDAVMRRLPAEYRREPSLALAGGRDGLDVVRRIVAQAQAHLTEAGVLAVEVGHNRLRVERAFPHLPLLWVETSGGDDCVFLITREALLARPARSHRATRAAVSPRQPERASSARASNAAATRRRRSARASGGSR